MLPYEQGAMLRIQFPERFGKLYATNPDKLAPAPAPSLYYHPAQAGDGRWLQFGNLLPHLFDNFHGGWPAPLATLFGLQIGCKKE